MESEFQKLMMSLGRRALVAKQSSVRPESAKDVLSRQGGCPLGLVSEEWPIKDGKPLFPLLTIATPELPFIPHFLTGFEYWVFFVELDLFEQITDDGSLVVHKYRSMEDLKQLSFPGQAEQKLITLKFIEVMDYPDAGAIMRVIEEDPAIARRCGSDWLTLLEPFPCHDGIKLGGYPTLIQGTAFLECFNPDFQIQIDCTELYMYCDSGIGYLYNALSAMIWETM